MARELARAEACREDAVWRRQDQGDKAMTIHAISERLKSTAILRGLALPRRIAVSFLKPKFVLVALTCVLGPAALASGCTGGAFSADNGSDDTSAGAGAVTAGGSGGSGNGESGNVGTGAGTGKLCGGPEDCNDSNARTTDTCNADGTCGNSPKCTGTQKYCDGDCAECCKDDDCEDGVKCTDDTCFSGQCMYVPNDTLCDATQYCSAKDDCRTKQVCGIVTGEDKDICADESPCTTDSCVDNFCQHNFCRDPNAKFCCDGVGCAACCNDSQCDTDTDPCTVGSCQDGKCNLVSLCGDGQECCPSADGKTATCGACCSAANCDDKIGCTDDKCGGGQCSNTPNNSHCDAGYLCNPDLKGCAKAPVCSSPSQCHPSACQINPRCDGGTCHFDPCSATGLKCCAGGAGATSNGCAICCADTECGDNIACTTDACTANGCIHTPDGACAPGEFCDARQGCIQCNGPSDCNDKLACTTDMCSGGRCLNFPNCPTGYCDPVLQKCVTCTSDADCQGGVVTTNIAQPPIGGKCSQATCEQGMCVDALVVCAADQTCCPPYGCTNSNFCGIMTQ
jgi:hypothetical protein